MIILDKQPVVRYFVEFADDEANALQTVSMLPPDCLRPARLWLTASELIETLVVLYGQEKAAAWVESLKRGAS